ncbi:hypothetical protein V8C44DRAFT_354321 [Trichoderma aethiopicum]
MDALADVELEADVEEVLQKLPDTVDGGYENTMDRTRDRGGLGKDRAESTLAWVGYAQRPLSIHELQHALAINGTPRGIEKKHLRKQDKIMSDCYGVVQNLDGMVRYVHFSAQEYFHCIEAGDLSEVDRHTDVDRHISEIQNLPEPNVFLKSSLSGAEKSENYPLLRYAGEQQHTPHRSVQTLRDGER